MRGPHARFWARADMPTLPENEPPVRRDEHRSLSHAYRWQLSQNLFLIALSRNCPREMEKWECEMVLQPPMSGRKSVLRMVCDRAMLVLG